MLKRFIILALSVLSCVGLADPPRDVTVNFSSATAPGLEAYQCNQRTFRFALLNGTAPVSLSNATPYAWWAPKATSSGIVTAACSVVSSNGGVFDATFSPSDLNTNGSMVYGVGLRYADKPTTARIGILEIKPDPYAAGAASVQFSRIVDCALYSWIHPPWTTNTGASWESLGAVSQRVVSAEAAIATLAARPYAPTNAAQLAAMGAVTGDVVRVELDTNALAQIAAEAQRAVQAENGLGGRLTTIEGDTSAVTNGAGLLERIGRSLSLTYSSLTNALAGLYAPASHPHSYTAITNAPWLAADGLPTNSIYHAYDLLYADTNNLVLIHSAGNGTDLSGFMSWQNIYSATAYANNKAEVFKTANQWVIIDIETDETWANSDPAGLPAGTYYPASESAFGTIFVAYQGSQTSRVSALPNGQMVRTLGTNVVPIYDGMFPQPVEASSGATYEFDPLTLTLDGDTVSVAPWLPALAIATWFKDSVYQATSTGGFVGGPAYVFSDANGILADKSSGYSYASPWYANTTLQAVPGGCIVGAGTAGSSAHINAGAGIYGTGSRTYSVWFKTSASVGVNQLLAYGNKDYSTGRAILINTYYGMPGFAAWGRDLSAGVSYADGEWHIMTCRYDAGINLMDLWVDGVSMDQSTDEEYGTPLDTEQVEGDYVRVGEELVGPSQYLSGSMDDLCIWSRALSDAEIIGLYNSGVPVPIDTNAAPYSTGLHAAWSLDEGTGTNLTSVVDGYAMELQSGMTWGSHDGSTTVATNMNLVGTNSVLSVPGTTARIFAAVQTTAHNWTTNELKLAVVDIGRDTTAWATGLEWITETAPSNQLYAATVHFATNAAVTNGAAACLMSSNITAKVLGLSAIFAP